MNEKKLYPLTYTCAVSRIRMGIFTAKERWQRITGEDIFIQTADYLQPLYNFFTDENNLWIDASVIADNSITQQILSLKDGVALADDNGLIAGRAAINNTRDVVTSPLKCFKNILKISDVKRLEYCWQIFQWNDEMIRSDFSLIKKNKTSQKISLTNKIICAENI